MISDSLAIEFARHRDAMVISALSRHDIEQGLSPSWSVARVRKAMHEKSTNVIVAKQQTALVGFAIMHYGNDGANLELLAVSEPYRRKGVATQLIAWLEKVALTAGLNDVSVQLRQNNHGAKALYSMLGFEVIDHVPGYYQGEEAAWIMCKQLTAQSPE